MDWTNWLWIGLIIADVGVQATKEADDSQTRLSLLSA